MSMKNRKSKRFPTNITGVIIIEGKSYVGNLINISEEGVGYLSMLDSFYYQNSIAPKKMATILFKNTSDYLISLNCEIMWAKEDSSDSSKPYFGFKIKDPPNTLKELVNTLE